MKTLLNAFVAVAALFSMAAPAFADANAEVLALIRKKQTEVQDQLVKTATVKEQLAIFKAELENAKTSRRISKFIGVPAVIFGAILAVKGVGTVLEKAPPSTGIMMDLTPFIKVAGGIFAAGGAAAVGGSGYYMYVKSSRVDELEQAVIDAYEALDQEIARLKAEQAELDALWKKVALQ